nr:retrovirus-related Pol polyprotein from transposon TNT 1-94 [Tanacetum cinerariifolium]
MRIEQYIQMMDYALWDDAKQLMEAIEKRFGGNATTKKIQRNILKQQYKNFTEEVVQKRKGKEALQKLRPKLFGRYYSIAHFLMIRVMWLFHMRIEVMIRVTKLKKDLNMHYWHAPLQVLIMRLMKSELMVLSYKAGLKSVEERLEFFKTNKSIYSEDIKKLKFETHCNEITIRELRKKLETIQKEKDGIQLTVEKLENTSKNLNKLIDSQILDKCKKGLGYNAVPPPHTGLFMPPKPDLSYIGLEEFTSEPAVETLNAKTSEDVPKVVKKDNGVLIIEDWKSDDEDERQSTNGFTRKKVTDSECSRHMTWNMSYLTYYEEIDGEYVAFGEAVSTACYVQNKVLVTKSHNKTLYELLHGRTPALSFMRPFGCPVTILNTIDHLGKFDGKADEGFFIGYLLNSKAFRVFNGRTRIVEETLHIRFSENTSRRQDTMGIPLLILEEELNRTKTAQQTKIDGLERRVKKLEKKHTSRTHKLKRVYKVSLTAWVISSSDDEALDTEDTSIHKRIDEIDADEDIDLVSTYDDELQDEGIEDVGEEEVFDVVTTAKMLIDIVVDAAQVTTAIADIPVTAAKTIVTTAPTITAESTKTNVK